MLKKLFLSTFVLTLLLASPALSQGLGKDVDAPTRLVNPIGGTEDKPQGEIDTRVIFGKAIKVTLGFLGTFTLGVFVYGGFLWLTSAGNSDKIQKGLQTMLYAVVGIFIIFGAYGILNTVITGIRGAATDTPVITAGEATVTPEDFNCHNLDNQACHKAASVGCVWVTFLIPNSDNQSYTACVNNGKNENNVNEKVAACSDFERICSRSANGNEEMIDACRNALESCNL